MAQIQKNPGLGGDELTPLMKNASHARANDAAAQHGDSKGLFRHRIGKERKEAVCANQALKEIRPRLRGGI